MGKKHISCKYCLANRTHPSFVVMIHDHPSTWISTTQPLSLHPDYSPASLIIGPFKSEKNGPSSEDKANIFTHIVRKCNRTFPSKAARGMALSKFWHMYDKGQKGKEINITLINKKHKKGLNMLFHRRASNTSHIQKMITELEELATNASSCSSSDSDEKNSI